MRDFVVTRKSLFVLLVMASLLCSGLVFGDDWANWRGPERTGISAEKDWNPAGLDGGPKILWKASIGIGFSSIAVADGRVYSMGNSNEMDSVFCFDAKTGKEIWKHSYKHPLDKKNYEGGPNATPTVADGKVYTLSKRGIAHCYDAKSGDVVWRKQLDAKRPIWGLASSALIVDDLVIYNAGGFGIALKKADGKVVWQNGKKGAGYSTPVEFKSGDVKAVIICGGNDVYAVEAATGDTIWRFPWKTTYGVNAADPIIKGDKVYVASGYGHGCALFKIAGKGASEVWSNKNMRSQMSGPVLLKGNVYGINQNQLACVDFNTGKKQWSAKVSGNGSVIIVDDKLIVLSDKGKLMIAQASGEAYKEISSAQILKGKCWTPPVFSDGMLYARTAEDGMVCVDLSN
jgi:outer membrane protein assembly factor BamB